MENSLLNTVPILGISVLLPLLAAAVIPFISKEKDALIRSVAMTASGIPVLAMLIVCTLMMASGRTGFRWQEQIDWLPYFGVSWHMGLDGISAFLTSAAWLAGFCACTIEKTESAEQFKSRMSLVLVSVSGFAGALSSMDLFVMIMFVEVAVLPLLLIADTEHDGSRDAAQDSSRHTVSHLQLHLQTGISILILAVMGTGLMSKCGSYDLSDLMGIGLNPLQQTFLFCLVFLGAAPFCAAVPFHSWLPASVKKASAGMAMLMGGVLPMLGCYIILRLGAGMLPEGAANMMPLLIIPAMINIFYGGLCALRQSSLSTMLSYLVPVQTGFIFAGMSCCTSVNESLSFESGLSGAVMMIGSYPLLTAMLFVITKTAEHRQTAEGTRLAAGHRKLYIAGALGLAGLPGLPVFAADTQILQGVAARSSWTAALAAAGMLLTALSIINSLKAVSAEASILGSSSENTPQKSEYKNESSVLLSASWQEKFSCALLFAASFLIGVFPGLASSLFSPAVQEILLRFKF